MSIKKKGKEGTTKQQVTKTSGGGALTNARKDTAKSRTNNSVIVERNDLDMMHTPLVNLTPLILA